VINEVFVENQSLNPKKGIDKDLEGSNFVGTIAKVTTVQFYATPMIVRILPDLQPFPKLSQIFQS
jgi:hypothetical protein